MAQLDESIVLGQSGHLADHDQLHKKANYVHDVTDYDAVGDGTTDDSTAIQAAIAAAEAASPLGIVFFPPLQYKIDTGLTVLDCDIESARGAELIVGTGIAAGITIGSSVTSCDNHRLQLPNVTRVSRDWDSTPTINTARGVLVAAADGCLITVGVIEDFSYGLVVEGDGNGVAYNTFLLSKQKNNAINIYLDNVNSGWSNQNTYIGGLNVHENIGGTPPYAGTRKLHIAQGNGNTFLGVSFEGDNAEFLAFIGLGRNNHFLNCRWESSGTSRITFQGTAGGWSQENVIHGGYDSDQLVVTADPLSKSRYNSILAERIQMIEGSHADGILLLENLNNTSRSLLIYPGDIALPDRDQQADYGARFGSNSSGYKATGDAEDRIFINHALGRIFLGTGSSDPTSDGYLRARSANQFEITANLRLGGDVGFYDTAPQSQPTITGARDDGTALADLLTELATLGLIIDSSTAS